MRYYEYIDIYILDTSTAICLGSKTYSYNSTYTYVYSFCGKF